MKSALEIRVMMRDNLQRELDNIEDLILKEALVALGMVIVEGLRI